jgi:DNA-binding transcriptional MerR regulator
MEKAKKRDEEKRKRKERRISEKRKKKVNGAKKGAEAPAETNRKPLPPAPKFDDTDPDGLIPHAPSLEDMYNNEVNHKYVLQSREKALEYWQELHTGDWSLKTEAEGVELYTKETGIDTQVLIKRAMEVHAPLETVATYMQDLDKEKSAKHQCDKLLEIRDISHGSRIVHFAIKGTLLLGSRDFCYCNTKYTLKNGSVLVVNHSVQHDNVPVGKPIRGVLESLVLMTPIDSDRTTVSNILRLDMKGNVPATMMNKLVEKQHDEYVLLKDGMEK